MATELQPIPDPKLQSLRQYLQRPALHDQLTAAIGTAMPPDQFIAHAVVAFSRPDVRACTITSQINAVLAMATLGVLPTLGEAALVVYNNKDTGQDEVELMVQWQGFKRVVERHPDIREVQPVLVHVTDSFSFTNGEVEHSYDPFNPARTINTAADIRGGYLRIIYRDGRPDKYHFTPVAHIEKCRMCAKPSRKTGKREVWEAWYEQMALKTILRDAYARRAVPVDPAAGSRLEQMLKADDALLGNDPARMALSAPESAALPMSKADRLAAALPPLESSAALDTTSQPVTEGAVDANREPPVAAPSPAATNLTVAALAAAVQQVDPAGTHGTVTASGPAGGTPTPPPNTQPPRFQWKTATPEARTQFTLGQIKLVDRIADPTQGLARLAKIGKGIKEAEVGPGYGAIMAAITAAEQAFLQTEDAGVPFAEETADVNIESLKMLLSEVCDLARLDEIEQSWRDPVNNYSADTMTAGLAEIAKARTHLVKG